MGKKIPPENNDKKSEMDMPALFLQSRQALQVTPGTMDFYRKKLGMFLKFVNPDTARRQDIDAFLIRFENAGNRHCYYRALRTFFSWREDTFGIKSPMHKMKPPKVPKVILPALSQDQVLGLIKACRRVRDKAIISLFVESGIRLNELARIIEADIDWRKRIIRVTVKGQKEGYAIFGKETEKYLKAWLAEYKPDGGIIWDLGYWGIVSMLRRLREEAGLPCNAHVYRRTFACLLRKSGLSTLTIKDLGRWESTYMVEHYTKSMGFFDSVKFYKPPLSKQDDA
ncbi:tyrosine-type recombinase/integrase [Chloroflexota bacterium]